jgi:flagellar hook-associated protein 3 FlgL
VRITSEVMVTRSLDRLQTRLQAYERAQSELGTGRKILRPSDDPAGARRAMSLEAALRAREQDLRNANDAQGWLDTADSALQSALQRLSRVRELALRGASDSGAAERQALAAEVREIAEELQGIANTRHVDRPLFGGFSDGDAVTWDGTEWVFAGTGEQITRRVSDSELVRVNVTAGEWLGTGAGTGNLLGLLEQLATDLAAGPAAQVGGRGGRCRRPKPRPPDA